MITRYLLRILIVLCCLLAPLVHAQHVLIESEQFTDLGGWDLDQQSMDQMGSPYLLAHGLGVPVRDATTTVALPSEGTYHVWVRTRDWVAPWNAVGAPGRFQLVIDGTPLDTLFGTEGADWHWQRGGTVQAGPITSLALHDLTGFEGRCDAIVLTLDPKFVPPNTDPEMTAFRRQQLGQVQIFDGGHFDLVVVGGGVAGTSAAVSAARNGLRVALVQDRPVLGGNASSEVRVWPEGHTRQRPFPHIGDIVEELCPPKGHGTGNAKGKEIYDDEKKLRVARAEDRINLLLEHRVNEVATMGNTIVAVVAQNTRSAKRIKLSGKFFADCTGDGTVGYLAGADYAMSDEGNMGASNLWNVLDQSNARQVLHCDCKDKDALTVQTQSGNVAAPFPRLPWALDLSDKPFPGRPGISAFGHKNQLDNLGGWFWESGFDKDPINDIERIRDLNMRAMYGAWDTLKNTDQQFPNHRLGWSAFIAGKRESRRLLGDVILKADDFRNGVQYPDPAFPNTWHIDIHVPHPQFSSGLKGQEFISEYTRGKEYSYKGPYWAPYRTLYSRNINNLFMAGRDISVEREAIGPIRVMRTCGMMGEVVGKAAWICVRHETSPRGVYEQHLDLLHELMRQPGAMRRDSIDGTLRLPENYVQTRSSTNGIDPATLEGIVIDDANAVLSGEWKDNGNLPNYIGDSYLYSSDSKATAKFPFSVHRAGEYEVRAIWCAHKNRATAANIIVNSLDGEHQVKLNQSETPNGPAHFQSLGRFKFDESKNFAVTFLVANSGGVVHVDAIQLVPVQN